MAVDLDITLNSVTSQVEFNIGDQTKITDKTLYIKFSAAGGDIPSIEIYSEPVAGAGFVPFVKTPFDLSIVSFNSDCSGIGFNDLARVGKLRFDIVGAVNVATSARLIIAS